MLSSITLSAIVGWWLGKQEWSERIEQSGELNDDLSLIKTWFPTPWIEQNFYLFFLLRFFSGWRWWWWPKRELVRWRRIKEKKNFEKWNWTPVQMLFFRLESNLAFQLVDEVALVAILNLKLHMNHSQKIKIKKSFLFLSSTIHSSSSFSTLWNFHLHLLLNCRFNAIDFIQWSLRSLLLLRGKTCKILNSVDYRLRL